MTTEGNKGHLVATPVQIGLTAKTALSVNLSMQEWHDMEAEDALRYQEDLGSLRMRDVPN